jgi:hypothetical protein
MTAIMMLGLMQLKKEEKIEGRKGKEAIPDE